MITIKAQVADQTGLAVRKDTLSLMDVNGFTRLKEFLGNEEDFQRWSKKTDALFAGMIKESEMMMEWSAEQVTEITMEHVELEFTPTTTNVARCVPSWEFVQKGKLVAHEHFSWTTLSIGTSRWNRARKKLNDSSDGEIKPAGLEAIGARGTREACVSQLFSLENIWKHLPENRGRMWRRSLA